MTYSLSISGEWFWTRAVRGELSEICSDCENVLPRTLAWKTTDDWLISGSLTIVFWSDWITKLLLLLL